MMFSSIKYSGQNVRQKFGAACSRVLSAGILLLIGTQVNANTLEDIKFSELPGDRFEIRMDFSESAPTPEGYQTDEPARIVVDLPGIENGVSVKNHSLSNGNAESATLISAGDRTRLVVNLKSSSSYTYRTESNQLILEIGGVAVADVAGPSNNTQTSSAPVSAQQSTQQSQNLLVGSGPNEVTGIDFRRGEEGEGRIIVNLSTPNIGIDMTESRGAIQITFEGADIPPELVRRLDVTDFATPVSFVDAENERLGGVIRIEAVGYYDYLAYQAENQYVLSVKPLTEREIERKEAEFAYTGEKLNLNFTNVNVNEVLGILADVAGFNLVTTDTVAGTITLRLTNVPWDQALDIVLKAKGLDKRIIGNVMRVAPAAEIAEQERQELETQKQLLELAPLRTEHIRISYANAKELFDLFVAGGNGDSAGSLLSSRGRAIVDERTNSIIITETVDKIAQFRELIDQLDIPIRQVQIEARIVIANSDFQKEMGVRWGGDGFKINGGDAHEFGGNLNVLEERGPIGHFTTDPRDDDPATPEIEGNIDTRILEDSLFVDLGVTNPAGNITYSFLSDDLFLELELSALQNEGTAEIVSQPKVITGDKQTAFIQSGTEVPYQEASASGATSTSFKEAVLKLEVTPQITPDGNIILDLDITQDSVGEIDIASGIPVIDITQIKNQVLVKDGATVVLGGILQTEQQEGVTKVPFLGDIPYIGRLFKQEVSRENKRELLIFITPRILPDELSR